MSLVLAALDDDEGILFTLEAMARTQGWEMRTTTRYEEFLGWVRGGEADLFLLDYHLPRMGGMGVLREAKGIRPEAPVLILTVEQSPEVAEDLLLEGAEDFIAKPLRLADFAARIRLHERLIRSRDRDWRERRKGIAPPTLRRVLEALRGFSEGAGIDETASACALAYTTAHRYLEHLVDRGFAVRAEKSVDGRPGRPSVRYRAVRGG